MLERFCLERPLARGAMGEVWAAHVMGTKEKVAVKLAHGDAALRASREAEALRRLDHPGVVGFVDAGDAGETQVLVMDLLDGVSLATRLGASPMDPPEAMELARQLAVALVHAHDAGVVHRDVKASNAILVKGNGQDHLVLIDFGLGLVEGSPRLSSGDVVLGSSHTMPPEQVQGVTAGPRADVYSLGALAFRMVTGRYPFHASSPVQVLAMHAHAKVPTLAQRARRTIRVPRGLESLLHAMLAKDPEQRPSAAEVADRISALAAVPKTRWVVVEPESEVDPDGVKPPAPASPPGLGRWGAAAAIGLVLAACMTWWVFS